MSELKVIGNQNFMEKEISVVLGGFGEGKKCMSDKTIAEIHNIQTKHVRERITQNINRFKETIDFIDFKQRVGEIGTLELLQNIGYSKQSITQAEHIYILSERGYAKLIKIMDTDLACEIHDKLIDEYFELREMKMPSGEELLALAVIEAQKTIAEKDQRINQMRPKEIFADAVATSHTSILIGDLAKILKQNGVEIGQKRLFEWLRTNGYLIKRKGSDWNMPTQKSMELGLFEVKESATSNPDGSVRINKTTKVTGKGQQYFINKFLSE